MRYLLVSLLAPVVVLGFSFPRPLPTAVRQTHLQAVRLNEPDMGNKSLLDLLFDFFYIALTPMNEKMDPDKVIKNPKKWFKPSSVSDLRKMHHSEQFWYSASLITRAVASLGLLVLTMDLRAVQDVIDEFTKKYVGEEDLMRQYSTAPLHALDKEEVMSAFRPQGALEQAEEFVAEGVANAVSRLDSPVDREKVVTAPHRFAKPLPLSKLRKAMKHDPNYFKH